MYTDVTDSVWRLSLAATRSGMAPYLRINLLGLTAKCFIFYALLQLDNLITSKTLSRHALHYLILQ